MFLTTDIIPHTRSHDKEVIADYSKVLDEFNLDYVMSEYYWQVGKTSNFKGWVLYLSAIKLQIPNLFKTVLPLLIQDKIPFKIIRDSHLAHLALDGHLGSEYLAKILWVYPKAASQTLELAKTLILTTDGFRGPRILTAHCIKKIVHTSWQTNDNTGPDHWPFHELTSPTPLKQPKLLNYRYYPVSTIKKDVKGDVLKALYRKTFWQIRSCIIKQGRQFMFCDDNNRDIKDRLMWQAELSEDLANDLPMPRIIDTFELEGDYYLVMDRIDGISLTNLFLKTRKDHSWPQVDKNKQIILVQYLLEVINIVNNLHSRGFVHRDITPENFLVDKNNRIWMIDLELVWSGKHRKPNPPFRLGTPGFVSPEQSKSDLPTSSEDIYALGAFMIHLFTNIHPTKLTFSSNNTLHQNLLFFIQEESISDLISSCLNCEPTKRPTLKTIITTVTLYRDRLQQRPTLPHKSYSELAYYFNPFQINNTIEASLRGLSNPDIIWPGSTWLSVMPSLQNDFGNEQMGTAIFPGWSKGISGPLWLIALAKKCGFDVSDCLSPYKEGWKYIDNHCFNSSSLDSGLFSGGGGMAMAIVSGVDSNLFSPANYNLLLEKCLSQQSEFLSLSDGLSGTGLALLRARALGNENHLEKQLSAIADTLLRRQKKDGSWQFDSQTKEKDYASLSLENGVPGVIWFLLNYLKCFPNEAIKQRVIKSIAWLLQIARSNNRYVWPIMHKSRTSTQWSTMRGVPGITLVLIKAYEVLGNESYRHAAEANLRTFPEQPVIMNFTFADGLSGIGELYLEAAKVFNGNQWLKRADWVAQLLTHTFQYTSEQDGHWLPERSTTYTADLFTGASGIIHFLMRYIHRERLSHPLNVS